MKQGFTAFWAINLLLFSLAGCTGVTYRASTAPSRFVLLAPSPPPSVPPETPDSPRDPSLHIWRPGYWDYDGRIFSWVPGTLIRRPSPSALWSPDRWERRAYGWAFVRGYWR